MPVSPVLSRSRHTAATKARNENLITVIEALNTQNMDVFEIEVLLGFSPSGTRKYLRDLSDLHMIEIVGPALNGKGQRYKITEDAERVKKTLLTLREMNDGISATASELSTELPASKIPFKQRHAGRQIFTSQDDVPFNPSMKKNAGEGHRDPLHAFLFGSPKAGEEFVLDLDLYTPEVQPNE